MQGNYDFKSWELEFHPPWACCSVEGRIDIDIDSPNKHTSFVICYTEKLMIISWSEIDNINMLQTHLELVFILLHFFVEEF